MITIDIKPGFYLTVSNEQVYYLYVANNQQIDPKYFAEIKRAIEKIINKKKMKTIKILLLVSLFTNNVTGQLVRNLPATYIVVRSGFGITDTVMTTYRHILIPNRKYVNAPQTGIIISNVPAGVNSAYPDQHYPVTGVINHTFNEEMVAIERRIAERDGDTLMGWDDNRYGGAMKAYTVYDFDSTSTHFGVGPGKKEILIGNGGFYVQHDFFPPKDSVRIFSHSNGQSANCFNGYLDFGREWGYNLNIFDDGKLLGWPLQVYGSTIDYNRAGSNNSPNGRRMTGSGVANYCAAYKTYQAAINSTTVERGHYISKRYGYVDYGEYSTDMGNATKAKRLRVSKVDTSIAFCANPQRTTTNDVNNGYGFVSKGDSDFNYFAGRFRVGGPTPAFPNDQLMRRIENTGTTYLGDTLFLSKPKHAVITDSILFRNAADSSVRMMAVTDFLNAIAICRGTSPTTTNKSNTVNAGLFAMNALLITLVMFGIAIKRRPTFKK